MINVGIVGFGNLGKAVFKELENNKEINVVGIFSRRTINHEKAFLYEDYMNFVNKIDIMIMCGGSEKDLPTQSKEIAKHFSIIDTFDNHPQITEHYVSIKAICEKYCTNAIVCCGWDPGLFSCFRVLFSSILNHQECFYGKGLSLGHTNALKNIQEVKNAIQYTIPIKKAIRQARRGQKVEKHKHLRLCYVATKHNKKQIKNRIKNIPNYFHNQKVKVLFVNEKAIRTRLNFAHKGEVISVFKNKEKISLNFKIKTTSNPVLTAKILVAYLNALKVMKTNKLNTALTPIQIPFSWLLNQKELDFIQKFC